MDEMLKNYMPQMLIKRESLTQEIYAKLTLFNFISLLVSNIDVITTEKAEYKYKPSFSNAIDIGRLFILQRIIPSDVVKMLVHNKTPVRPGRKNKRIISSQRLRTLQHRS